MGPLKAPLNVPPLLAVPLKAPVTLPPPWVPLALPLKVTAAADRSCLDVPLVAPIVPLIVPPMTPFVLIEPLIAPVTGPPLVVPLTEPLIVPLLPAPIGLGLVLDVHPETSSIDANVTAARPTASHNV
jgi:hypothetical protein